MKRNTIIAVILVLVFVLFGCGPTAIEKADAIGYAQPAAESTVGSPQPIYNLAYGNKSASQKLDMYFPAGKGPHPVVVWIHGGGWQKGDKRLSPSAPQKAVLKRGYVLVSINYRLSGEAIYPAQIQDVKAAIEWLRRNARKYRLDAGHIGVWGGSAGGHLANLIGTSGADANKVQAVVDWYGPSDLTAADMISMDTNHVLDKLLGGPVAENLDKALAASPVTYIDASDPAFLIQHGVNDFIVPPTQAQELYDRLVPAIGQNNVTLDMMPGGHGGPVFTTPANIVKILNFFDRYLKA